MPKEVIAIDGPAGAGKSTIAKRAAAALGFRYLDTGAMYRAVALLASRAGEDLDGATEIAREMRLEFAPGNAQRVLVDGEDVTDAIRAPEVGNRASEISVFGPLRRELVRRQQEILAEGRVVLEGRDTTTVVCPDARLKVFLTASVQERARRRWMELTAKGPSPSLDEIERQIEERDNRDITREDSPLKIAPDAVVIDTDGKTIPEVLAELLSAWNEASTSRG